MAGFIDTIISILEKIEDLLRRLPPPRIRNLKGKLIMATETLKWTDTIPAAEIASVDIYDSTGPTGQPPVNTKIGSVAGGVQTFTTPELAQGDHAFTAVVVGTNGQSSAPSNVVTQTVASTIPAITDLSGTFNP